MKKTKNNFFILVVCFLLIVVAIQIMFMRSTKPEILGNPSIFSSVKTYHVSVDGDNRNSGTMESPLRTIQYCADRANSNDICSVTDGVYEEFVTVTGNGITFQANGTVTMQGFMITGKNNVVDGFYVLDSTNGEGGIVIKGSNNIVRNNKIERATLVGIQVQGNNHLVENNEVLGTQARNSSDADGIRFFGDGNVIRGNYIHDLTYGSGEAAVDAHIDCFQTWATDSKGIATNTLIEQNVCVNMQYITSSLKGQGFMLDGSNKASNITIRNNVIRAYQTYILNISGLKIENNTFETYADGAALILQNDSDVTVKNNIFYNNSAGEVGGRISTCCHFITPISSGWNWSYQVYGNYYPTQEFMTPTDKIDVDPMFVNPELGDFRLQPNSPACTGGESGGHVGAFPCDF